MAKGTLYLVPTTLGKTPLNNSIPEHTLSVLRSLDSLVVENIQTSVKFLHWVGDTIPEYKIDFYHLNKNTPDLEIFSFLKPLKAGKNLGLLSEAGVPAVADPGSRLVEAPHRNNEMLKAIMDTASDETRICAATDITLDSEQIISKTVTEWKESKLPDLHKRPTIFVLYCR